MEALVLTAFRTSVALVMQDGLDSTVSMTLMSVISMLPVLFPFARLEDTVSILKGLSSVSASTTVSQHFLTSRQSL